MGIIRDNETGEVYYFQIEHSGSWEVEVGSASGGEMYVALLGPNDESGWWKNLKPGMEFTTVPAAFGVAKGDENTAIAELTKYRRCIRRENVDDKNCHVVFNDYMNCLMGDPTEEKEKEIIDKAAELGCEYYCLDCGWYDKGFWWDKVGEWMESPERFPNGLKTIYEYARSKGLKMGMWLEIEVMGTQCELAKKLPDDWFVCTHGKRRVDNRRYLLDFRNPEVRKYCMDVVDRLFADYGCEYFKVDYNVTTGLGSDLNCDSVGDAMLEHYRALYDWYREIYRKYPNLVIENCGSGAQRMDYGILALQSIQSTSDQTDYISNSYIAANVATAVTPEQAGMWVYPYVDEREHIIYNVVNGILLRPYISGLVWNISDESFDIFKEGISVYKEIRGDITGMVPYFPLGFTTVKSDVLAYGLKKEGKAYLSVFTPRTDEAEIPLTFGDVKSVKVIYPKSEDCSYTYENGILKIKMPQEKCARLFEITY
jgi:alpha-galactosidase